MLRLKSAHVEASSDIEERRIRLEDEQTGRYGIIKKMLCIQEGWDLAGADPELARKNPRLHDSNLTLGPSSTIVLIFHSPSSTLPDQRLSVKQLPSPLPAETDFLHIRMGV
jgi:hypothetical protein